MLCMVRPRSACTNCARCKAGRKEDCRKRGMKRSRAAIMQHQDGSFLAGDTARERPPAVCRAGCQQPQLVQQVPAGGAAGMQPHVRRLHRIPHAWQAKSPSREVCAVMRVVRQAEAVVLCAWLVSKRSRRVPGSAAGRVPCLPDSGCRVSRMSGRPARQARSCSTASRHVNAACRRRAAPGRRSYLVPDEMM